MAKSKDQGPKVPDNIRISGLLDKTEIRPGHILQFPSKGAEKNFSPVTTGYVHKVFYNPQKDDRLEFHVFPILTEEQARGGYPKFHTFYTSEIKGNTAFNSNEPRAIVLFPVIILADNPKELGRNGLANAKGFIEDPKFILNAMENFNIEDPLEALARQLGTGMKVTSPHAYGVTLPYGSKRNLDETDHLDFGVRKTGKQKPKKHDHAGKVLDMNLKDAVKAGLLDQETADLFEDPFDEAMEVMTSLRQIWNMAVKQPEKLEKYATTMVTGVTMPLKTLVAEQRLHPTIEWGLSEPRDPKKTPKILDLQAAYELVTQRPEDLKKYNYLGAATQEKAKVQIPALYSELAASSGQLGAVSTHLGERIKTQWQKMADQYVASLQGAPVPPNYLDEKQRPLWKLVTLERD